jgi:hypothetical protein
MKKLITNYTFDASAQTVELSDYGAGFDIRGLLLIVNVTDNIIIYNFAVDGLGHTGVADDVITLEYNTASPAMADADKLLIYYDDASATQATSIASGQVASGAVASGAFASGSIASGAIAAGAVAAGAVVSGAVLSGAFASGSIASGALASGSIASGAIASGAVASGAIVSGAVMDGSIVTLGAKTDAKSDATDGTSITAMQVLKQISESVQETATDTGNMDTDTGNIAGAIGTQSAPAGATGVQLMGESRTIDGSAFPPVDAEGDSTTLQCSIFGVPFMNLVTENGADTPVWKDGLAQVATPGFVNIGGEYRASPTTYTDGWGAILQSDINGNLKTVKGKYSTVVTNGSVTIGTSSTEILDALAARKYFVIVNDSDETIYISLGAATVGDGIRLNANGGSYTDDMWTGAVFGRCTSGSKDVTITEV